MPNCFHLLRKTDGQPETLVKVDEQLCNLLGLPVHPNDWCLNWFHTVGFSLACGKSFAQIREREQKKPDEWSEQMMKIIDFLDEHYTSDAWVQVGK